MCIRDSIYSWIYSYAYCWNSLYNYYRKLFEIFYLAVLLKYFFLKLDSPLLINAAAIPKETANKIENNP